MRAPLRYASIFFIIVLLFFLSAVKNTMVLDRNIFFLDKDSLNALLFVKDGIYLKQGHTVGFHFDLLKRFAALEKCQINIRPARNTDPWGDLMNHKADILVVDSQNDTIPEIYEGEVLSSIELNDYTQVWVVRKDDYNLLQQLNYWMGHFRQTKEYNNMVRKYYGRYNGQSVSSFRPVSILSPYDNLIKKYSKTIDWDWRLLASLIFQESKFLVTAQSGRGAHGLMQIKHETAKQFNVEDIFDPEQNIMAGTMLIRRLQKLYRKEKLDSANNVKFILAAYNSGEGRLEDVRNFAQSRGLDPNDWNSVKEVIPLMRKWENIPEGLLKLGTFRGIETINFVNDVLSRFEDYKLLVR